MKKYLLDLKSSFCSVSIKVLEHSVIYRQWKTNGLYTTWSIEIIAKTVENVFVLAFKLLPTITSDKLNCIYISHYIH